MAEKRVFKSPIISLYLSIKFTDSLFGKPANEPTESTLPLQHLVSVCVCVCVCVYNISFILSHSFHLLAENTHLIFYDVHLFY